MKHNSLLLILTQFGLEETMALSLVALVSPEGFVHAWPRQKKNSFKSKQLYLCEHNECAFCMLFAMSAVIARKPQVNKGPVGIAGI